jgi:hypothetical protein
MKKAKFSFETSYDVVVCGGGIAGVAAALASARRGLKTCLIEKTVFTGGLATTGNVLIYLPLSDRKGRQTTFGLSEELMLESVKYGPGTSPLINDWSKGHQDVFNPASFIMSLDEILLKNGVDVWFDSLVCGAKTLRGKLVAVEVENKSGRGVVNGKSFVDATGDADIAFRAGAPCAVDLNHMTFWATGITPEVAKQLLSEEGVSARQLLMAVGAWDDGTNAPQGMRKFDGVNAKDVSEFILTGRRLLREKCVAEQAKLGPDGRSKYFPMGLPAMANFRTTRRIEAQYTLGDGEAFKHFKDCVGLVTEWKQGNEIWELPYRALLPKKVKGLLTAGRCIGARDFAWSTFRVIQAAAMSGEVAGLSASLSAERGISPDKLPIADLQSELKTRKFLLDVRELS